MISLASATSNVRLLAKIIGGVAVIGIVGFLLFELVIFIIESQKPPEPPAKAFGEIPSIVFPNSGTNPGNFTYEVNTLDGSLPVLPDRLLVYKTTEPSGTFLDLQNARDRINKIGFNASETKLEGNLYQWTSSNGKIIKYDILSHNFDISSSYIFNPPSEKFEEAQKQRILNSVYDLLTNLDIDTEDLSGIEDSVFSYFVIQNNALSPVDRMEQAQIVRIDLFQNSLPTQGFAFNGEKLDEMPVVYPISDESTMNFLLQSGRSGGEIVEAHFKKFPIDRNTSSDYPIITIEEAWERLKSGDAYLAEFDPKVTNVDILDVGLGYYMQDTDSGFVMPVIRFTGTNFEAYVDAIDRTPEEKQQTSEAN